MFSTCVPTVSELVSQEPVPPAIGFVPPLPRADGAVPQLLGPDRLNRAGSFPDPQPLVKRLQTAMRKSYRL
jgi:hypothetical protein